MASSLQAFVGSAANGIVAGVIAPLVMDSTVALAGAALAMLMIGLVSWIIVRRHWPEATGEPLRGAVDRAPPAPDLLP
jgi:DHA1 family bicyclomycin/chloramphenicol resistance-like MFS transporter